MQHSPIQPKPDATPPDTNGEKATTSNFFANEEWLNSILFAAVVALAIVAICFSLLAQNISHEHLNKTQQLLQEIKEGRGATSETIKEIDSLRNAFSIYGLHLILTLIILVSCFSKPIMKLLKEYPQRVFVSVVALGGFLAFSIPQYLYSFKYIGETKDITTSLLTVTGGILAVFTLLKTHQKSELEREQLDTQKKKDDRDHIRQLHNSYNDRFDKALVELHGDDTKATYAAVPKLAKLADSWLDYEDLSNDREELEKLKKKAKKEAQTIINILCKYIRTMPGKYTEKDLKDIPNLSTADQDKLKNESEVRRLIFSEMSDRSSKDTFENKKLSTTLWSELDFDFSRAPIFYPLNNLTIEKGIFTSAKFYGNADFSGSTFIRDTAFNGAQFTKEAIFNEVTFNGKADFSTQGDVKTTFGGKATFNGAQFIQDAYFNEVTFNRKADFSTQGETKTTFEGDATFNGTQFTQKANFNGAQFIQKANFNEVTFNRKANFSAHGDTKTTFGGKATFNSTQFKKTALFNKTIFNETDFSGSTMNKTIFTMDAIFAGTEFTKNTSFNNVEFNGLADFSSHSQNLIQPITFGDTTEFVETDFNGKANFMGLNAELDSTLYSGTPTLTFKKVNFNEEAIFTSAQISLSTIFENTHFYDRAEFVNANFFNSVKFIENTQFELMANFFNSMFLENLEVEAWFKNGAKFGMSQFGTENGTQQKTTFRKTHFDGDTIFSDSDFYAPTDFIDINVQGETNFTDTRFHGTTSFNNSHSENLFKFAADAYFDRVKFKEPINFIAIRFCNKVNFENAIFYKDSKFEDMYFDSFSPDFNDAEFEAKSNHSFTTNSNSGKQFGLCPINPKSTGQPISLPRGSFLFTDTPGDQRIGPA
ncbi:pentapeptide repeat-containing protein [uncultured Rothia sp.]|uniref:pentapeptide repeat-containing protein n=1 Tax=uncultured Rothia sp. TaxID=316088 RepID=UPI0028DBCB7B|nr:pentapeptide repeat-containing protein [uncultured Rothia sp.]